ncbi:MAG: hypothetical protein MRY64_16945 [Hyphomonadaceae bacterium]|nr:hypothetical protein [Hyphomonadaceae bacterium]
MSDVVVPGQFRPQTRHQIMHDQPAKPISIAACLAMLVAFSMSVSPAFAQNSDELSEAELLDPFRYATHQPDRAAGRAEAKTFWASRQDIYLRILETGDILSDTFDIPADFYSAGITCLASYKLSAQAGDVSVERASVRMDEIMFQIFSIKHGPDFPPPEDLRRTLAETTNRIYVDYLLGIEGGRVLLADNRAWATDNILFCDNVFAVPEPVGLKIPPPPPSTQ